MSGRGKTSRMTRKLNGGKLRESDRRKPEGKVRGKGIKRELKKKGHKKGGKGKKKVTIGAYEMNPRARAEVSMRSEVSVWKNAMALKDGKPYSVRTILFTNMIARELTP